MPWTDEQLEAINIIDVNTTVSASAGAGKTAVLVQRLMKRILKDGVSVDQIVSLTFTDAAAAEMKNRLMSALLEEFEKDPKNDYLAEQITLLPMAKISTIHSFCLSILKDYYYTLGLNPEALENIIDESDQLLLHSEAFNHTLASYDKKKVASLLNYLSAENLGLNTLNEMIKGLLNEANTRINPNKFLYESISIYRKFDSLEKLEEPFKSMFFNYHKNIVKNLVSDANSTYRLLDDTERDTSNQREWLSLIIDNEDLLNDYLNKYDYEAYRQLILKIIDFENKTIYKFTEYTEARNQIYTYFNDLAKVLYSESELLEQLSSLETVLNYLIEMTIIYNDYYKNGVKELNKITFNDMETLTYEVLSKNDNEVAKEIAENISDILVDEYQDTNELQDEIIKLISNGRNIFRVGDVKQSIYRFRGAKPDIMQALINQENSDTHQTIYLSNNFRSKYDIVHFNNHFFDKLMNIDNFKSSYLANDKVEVGVDSQKEDSKAVELHIVHTDNEDEEVKKLSNNDVQAAYIANKILELYNEANDNKWNKYTVLVNSHSRKLDLKKAFDYANIPYFISLPDGLYSSKGVSLISAYLKLVYDPSDTISLMAVLCNLYNYTDNEITKLFLEDANLINVANKLDENILKTIHKYNKEQYDNPIADIVNFVLSINNLYEDKLSKQERVNVDIFYEKVLNYDLDNVGVYSLLKQIELDQDAKAKEGSSISEEDNVVNVMTVHNSKGLQFDTVFFMSKSAFKDPNDRAGYILHPSLGLAIKSSNPENRSQKANIAYTFIKEQERLEAVEEEMRKLYVALTRAQRKMYIVDKAKLKDDYIESINPLDYDLVTSKSYTKWIESLNFSFESDYLTYHLEEELKLDKTDRIESQNEEIEKLSSKNIYKNPYTNSFKVESLNFSNSDLGVSIGTLVHNTMENLDYNNITRESIKEISPDLSSYYIDRILNLANNDFFKTLIKYETYKEYPIIANINNERYRSIVDLFIEADEDIYIIDFKTDSFDDEADFIKTYFKQLELYKKALSINFKDKTIHRYIYSFKLEKFIDLNDNIV